MAIYLIVLTCVLTHAGFGGAKVALPNPACVSTQVSTIR